MPRTKLADRTLPPYTRGEEIFNMVSHIVGGGFGVVALALCVVFAVLHRNWWGLGTLYRYLMFITINNNSWYNHFLNSTLSAIILAILGGITPITATSYLSETR